MKKTTVGQLLINSLLPDDLKDYSRVLDKKGVSDLLQEVAKRYPEKYNEISHKLIQIGDKAAYATGSNSFGLAHMLKSKAGENIRGKITQSLSRILDDDNLSDIEREKAIVDLASSYSGSQADEIYKESLSENNPLALQLKGAGRGNPLNLASLRGSDLLYVDHRNHTIPVPVLRSYSEGLTPAEYWAGTYGARAGVIATKLAVADSGYLSKILNQVTHREVVDEIDDPNPPKTLRGLPVDVDDQDSEGSLLAIDIGGYTRNTILTPKILKDLKDKGVDKILVRSPAVTGTPSGGLYSMDVGVRERGGFPAIGELPGMTAAQALGEVSSQSTLCLAAGTLVRMADFSVKPIQEICPGDYVLGSNRNGCLKPVKVLALYDNGERDCIRTEFSIGLSRECVELVSTADHKILADVRKWSESVQVCNREIAPLNTKCTRLNGVIPNSIYEFEGITEPYALLIGLLLGDGCYTESVHGVHFSCFDDILIEDIQEYLSSLNLKATKLAGHRGYYRISQIEQPDAERNQAGQFVKGARNPAIKKLQSLDMYGLYAHQKSLPAESFAYCKESLRQLLSGLFVTDGSIYVNKQNCRRGTYEHYISFVSTSLKMVQQIKELLSTRFAIYSGPISANTSGRKRVLYGIVISRRSEVRKFLEEIPLYGIKKQTADKLSKQENFLTDKDFTRFYRKSTTKVGSLPTYDIEVDNNDHLFVLENGLIVSNSSKHAGGVAGASSLKAVSGFDHIQSLVQVPKMIKGGATHAEIDGQVQSIEPSDAGGYHIRINGKDHYVGQGFGLKVKPGDVVEAGDTISDGIPNPAEIVKHKGIGEGRRYFIDAFRNAYKGAGLKNHRRNIELLSRGLINHVKLEDEINGYVPDDIVPYSHLESTYEPREGFKTVQPKAAVGHYLERPYLHYSIGTKIRPSMLPMFDKFGVKEIDTHPEPPPFSPVMVRGMDNLGYDPDFMTRMLGSGLKGSLLDSVHRGSVSDEHGTSYVPSLAKAIDFGRSGVIKTPGDPIKPSVLSKAPSFKTTIKKAYGDTDSGGIFGNSIHSGPGQTAMPSFNSGMNTPRMSAAEGLNTRYQKLNSTPTYNTQAPSQPQTPEPPPIPQVQRPAQPTVQTPQQPAAGLGSSVAALAPLALPLLTQFMQGGSSTPRAPAPPNPQQPAQGTAPAGGLAEAIKQYAPAAYDLAMSGTAASGIGSMATLPSVLMDPNASGLTKALSGVGTYVTGRPVLESMPLIGKHVQNLPTISGLMGRSAPAFSGASKLMGAAGGLANLVTAPAQVLAGQRTTREAFGPSTEAQVSESVNKPYYEQVAEKAAPSRFWNNISDLAEHILPGGSRRKETAQGAALMLGVPTDTVNRMTR